MPCLRYVMAVCALCLPLSALAAGVPEARFFNRDASDYALAAEIIGHGVPHVTLDATLDAAAGETLEAERLRASEPDSAFGPAKRAMFRCVYAWMLIQRAGQPATPEQTSRAREILGRLRTFFEWDKPSLDRIAAGIGGLLQDVLTAREAREIASQGIDPKEAAAAKALEK